MSPQESFKNILKKLDKRCKITFAGTLGIGFFAHFFILVNVIQNSDNINCSPFSAGAGISSGRWGLELINRGWHRIWGVYNIPFFNALLGFLVQHI